jgi:hypothetical protein
VRVTLATLAVVCACQPLRDTTGCPKPCPASCPASCLSMGYCSEVRYVPTVSPAVIRFQAETLDLALGDLPPNAPVLLALHGVFDLVARGDTIPWDYQIILSRLNADTTATDLISVGAFNAVEFPIVSDWSGSGVSDSAGVVDLRMNLSTCWERTGRADQGCVLLPDSFLVARVSDPTFWEAAPACQ